MPDEVDAQLLRRFAESYQPLVDAQFVAQVLAHVPPTHGIPLRLGALRSLPGTIFRGLLTGICAPLRLHHVGVMAIAAAAVSLWAAFA